MHDEKKQASHQEDEILVRAFQAGDVSAFDALVMKYKDKVYTMCFYLIGDVHEANDQSQETFLKVFRSLHAFRLESTFSTWLHRITVNTCTNRLKSIPFRIRKMMVSLDAPDEAGNAFLQIPDESLMQNGELEKREKMMAVKNALGRLSPDHRTMIILRDMEGLPYEEIARITELDLGTVKSRIARARQELRTRLEGYR
jgi:RNA polymerase sigma-70 factor, ECF subfamily